MSLINALVPSFSRAVSRTGADDARDAEPRIRPYHWVNETPAAFEVEVHLPGVAHDGLDVTAGNGELVITGRRAWKRPDSWVPAYRESVDAACELRFQHGNTINADGITAELKDGILRLNIPKAEEAKPRKIAIS